MKALKKQWVKIEVTKKDIKHGRKGQARFCPVARAMKRLTLHKKVWVGGASVSYRVRGSMQGAKLPRAARAFIERFDRGQTVKPFSFSVRVLK